LFVGDAPVVQVKDRTGRVQTYSAAGSTIAWKGPLVVLTSRHSAGGAEILAGAVKDYHRGLIIGDDRTTGMGTVGTLTDIGRKSFGGIENPPKMGYLKLTTQKFYRASGQGFQIRGVTSHIVLPSAASATYSGEAGQRHALSFDTVPAAAFQTLEFNVDETLQNVLAARSKSRQDGSPWFDQWYEKLAHAKANQELVHVSLNEQVFLARKRTWPEQEDSPTVPGIPRVTLGPYLIEALAIALDYTSRVQGTQAAGDWSQGNYSAAIDRLKKAVGADPGNTGAHYLLAWYLSTCPTTSLRDGSLALKHAGRSCELDKWKTWNYVLALSMAEAEAGRFDDAVEHVRQALDMAPPAMRQRYADLETRFRSGRSYGQR
jgi:tetratricopeptide (TPR) repeat protein